MWLKIREKILNNLDETITQGRILNAHTLLPTLEERKKLLEFIHNFISEKNMLLYGSTAIDFLLQERGKKLPLGDDKIEEIELPDYDVYTPNLVRDSVEICNKLHEKEYKYVNRISAKHAGTFRVGVEFFWVLDLSYMPEDKMRQIQTIKVSGLQIPEPQYLKIDLYKGLTGPCVNTYRWVKDFRRMLIIEEEFPLEEPQGSAMSKTHDKLITLLPQGSSEVLSRVMEIFGSEAILMGIAAYNTFPGVEKIPLYSLDLFSSDPDNLGERILVEVSKTFGESVKKHSFEPILEHLPEQTVIFIKEVPVIHIFAENPEFFMPEWFQYEGKKISRYFDLLKFLYTKRFYSIYKTMYDKMIRQLIDCRMEMIRKPDGTIDPEKVLGEEGSHWEIFTKPQTSDYCWIIDNTLYRLRKFKAKVRGYRPAVEKKNPEDEEKEPQYVAFLDQVNLGREIIEIE